MIPDDGRWFPAYAQLMIGREPISRPVLCKCRIVNKVVHFSKIVRCGPAKCTRTGPVDVVFSTHNDEVVYRFKVAHHATPGLIGVIKPLEEI